jgi:hypothetical protein
MEAMDETVCIGMKVREESETINLIWGGGPTRTFFVYSPDPRWGLNMEET